VSPQVLKAERVSNSVYSDTSGDGRSNFGAIALSTSIVAIDASMFPSIAQDFRKHVENITGRRFAKLVLTHYHADHVFGNQVFKDCIIISSMGLKTRMLEEIETEWTPKEIQGYGQNDPSISDKLKDIEITLPTETFESSLIIKDKQTQIEIRCVGGHTADSSYVYFPSERVLFSGDIIFASRFPWGGDATANPDKWLEALRELSKLKIDLIIPGHGPKCDSSEIKKYTDFFEGATKTIKDIVAAGGSKEDVLSSKDYPEFYPPKQPEGRTETLSRWYEFYKRLQDQGGRAKHNQKT
jgi:glyoxylase-like metal-dependent hydrolase (beta-lactamase superfamily II)